MTGNGWDDFNNEGYTVNTADVSEGPTLWEKVKTGAKVGSVIASIGVSLWGLDWLYKKIYVPFKESYDKGRVNTGPSKERERVMPGYIYNNNSGESAFRQQMKSSSAKAKAEDAEYEVLN